jgi:DNA invertase Pin-like site-specific DNA recombinase
MIAAAYLRKSTDQSGVADEEKSIARQPEHARAYAIKKGWTLAEEFVYTDDGSPARSSPSGRATGAS